MAGKVTIQDIADALGLSRNTVSKAINNTGVLAEATKKKILMKAMEMGYKTFSYAGSPVGFQAGLPNSILIPLSPENPKREIALFLGGPLDNSHFASTMLDKFHNELSQLGYTMTMHRVTPEDFEELRLPLSFRSESTAAILCVEVFHYPYCQMLCGLGIPLLLVDAPVDIYAAPLPADLILMENSSGIYQTIKTAREKGITKIGFVGEPMHCRSFFERFIAFREAMFLYSLPIDERYCLTDIHPHGKDYREFLKEHLREMEDYPELFICANDFVAIDMLIVMRQLGISCPGEVMLCGFDDSPESKVVTPSLTTVHIHSQIMGLSAAQLMISRIRQPELNFRILHTETDLIYRESTRGEFDHA